MNECVTCGSSFTAANPARNTCSDACNHEKLKATWARYRQRVREKPNEKREEQVCSRCGECLPASAFDLNRARRGGLQNNCKECRAEYAKRPDQVEKDRLRKHVWYLINYDRYRQRQRQRWANDPVWRWQMLQDHRARYHADPNRQQERVRERKRWEAEDRRRCFCGKALPGEGERWFCRPKCKVECSRFVCGLA